MQTTYRCLSLWLVFEELDQDAGYNRFFTASLIKINSSCIKYEVYLYCSFSFDPLSLMRRELEKVANVSNSIAFQALPSLVNYCLFVSRQTDSRVIMENKKDVTD